MSEITSTGYQYFYSSGNSSLKRFVFERFYHVTSRISLLRKCNDWQLSDSYQGYNIVNINNAYFVIAFEIISTFDNSI